MLVVDSRRARGAHPRRSARQSLLVGWLSRARTNGRSVVPTSRCVCPNPPRSGARSCLSSARFKSCRPAGAAQPDTVTARARGTLRVGRLAGHGQHAGAEGPRAREFEPDLPGHLVEQAHARAEHDGWTMRASSSGSASPRPGDPKRVPDRSIGRDFRPPESRSASRQIRATCEFRPVITRIAGSRLGGGGRRGGLGWR